MATSGHTQWGQGTGTKLDPKGIKRDGPGRTSAIPDTGVFYVKNDPNVPCTPRYGHNATTSYTSSPYCGDVAVKGTYPEERHDRCGERHHHHRGPEAVR